MYKYRTIPSTGIEKRKVVRETAKQVIYIDSHGDEVRQAKKSFWFQWCDSFEEAQTALIDSCKSKIADHQKAIDIRNKEISIILGLKKDEENL